MINPQESFDRPVVTVGESTNIDELVTAVEAGVNLLIEKKIDAAELKKDLVCTKLIRSGQTQLSEISKIKNQTIREKVSEFLIRLGVSVDVLQSVPESHLKKHDKGWIISRIHPDGKTVDLAKGMEVSSDVKTRIVTKELSRKDNVPIEDLTLSKEQNSFEKEYPVEE